MRALATGASIALLILSAVPALGQTATADPSARLAEELTGIRQALQQLVVLQTRVQRDREVEVLFKRIEVAERRLAPTEKALRTTEAEIQEIENSQRSLAGMREQHEERRNAEIREGIDSPHSETRRMLDDIERTLVTLAERLEAAERRARRYEDELAEQRKDIEVLDERLLEMLEEDRP